ncbi:MAG: class I SAM-dependent methyltransferase [Candidatus Diapherotrites archaeon]|nr:class I SAM-dependent methyltransferase [Candidatus Diapherotrites archaeon]
MNFDKKIKSGLVENKSSLKGKYEEVYSQTFFTSFAGIHSCIINSIKNELLGKKVIDIGCGAGRLSIFASAYATKVDGFDFSEKAIEIATLLAECCSAGNTNFFVGDAGNSKISGKYQVALISEVIEHAQNPLDLFKKANDCLEKNGLLVVSCPNFHNFRGFTYMTMLSLFDFPMSIADLRQVFVEDIEEWAKQSGFKLERTIGLLYDLGWVERAFVDMKKRVPLAAQDKKVKGLNYKAYNKWLEASANRNKELVNWLEKNGYLKEIKRIKVSCKKTSNASQEFFEKAAEYISDEKENENRWCCEKAPFNKTGAGTIFVLRKADTAKKEGDC